MLVAMCALVFMFALRAKTSGYNGDAPPKVTPSTASKLLLSQKMEVQAVDSSTAMLFWMTVACFFGLFLHRDSFVPDVIVLQPSSRMALHYLHRFLRPPPVVA